MSSTRNTWAVAVVMLSVSGLIAAGCQQASPPAPEPGPYVTTATIKDLMQGLVDPSADVVWNAVGSVSTESGMEDRRPKNDDDWKEVRWGALRLIESTNLLLMPGRHVARPHEKSEAPGVELEPAEMEVLINKDRSGWNTRVKALHDAGLQALAAADAKDADKLFEVGEHIEEACEHCHSKYWYPNQQLPPTPVDLRGPGATTKAP